jgi:hypothetical protein
LRFRSADRNSRERRCTVAARWGRPRDRSGRTVTALSRPGIRTCSFGGSGRSKPRCIRIATYLQKVTLHFQSSICRLAKSASAKVEMALLEPTPLRVQRGHRPTIFAVDTRLGTRSLQHNESCLLSSDIQNPISRSRRISPRKMAKVACCTFMLRIHFPMTAGFSTNPSPMPDAHRHRPLMIAGNTGPPA